MSEFGYDNISFYLIYQRMFGSFVLEQLQHFIYGWGLHTIEKMESWNHLSHESMWQTDNAFCTLEPISSSNFIPNRKQSTAYMSKDTTSVNQYTLMFCWWSPGKPKAHLAGNQKSGRDRLSAGAADHGFMNPREWPAQPSSGDRLHKRARQPQAMRTDSQEHNSLQVRTHDRKPQGPARVPPPAEGTQRAPPMDSEVVSTAPTDSRTCRTVKYLNRKLGSRIRGEGLRQSVLGLKDTSYLVIYISWMEVKISTWFEVESKYIY